MKTPAWTHDLISYDFRQTIALQYSHIDTIRHVNNVAAHGLHLEARMRYQMRLLGNDCLFSDDLLLRPRRTITHFMRETHYPDDVTIAAQPVAVDANSYRLITALFQHDSCVGLQDTRMGAWHDDAWRALPDPVQNAIASQLNRGGPPRAEPLPEAPPAGIDLGQYPIAARLTGRYADLDADRVIGELALSRYIEQSRAGSLRPVRDDAALGLLVASVDLSYQHWHDDAAEAMLGAGIDRIGNTSFSMAGAVEMAGQRLATARTTMVVIDHAQRRPTPISATVREAMQALRVAESDDATVAPASG